MSHELPSGSRGSSPTTATPAIDGAIATTGLPLRWLYAQSQLHLRPITSPITSPITQPEHHSDHQVAHPADMHFTTVGSSELADPGEFLPPGSIVLTTGVGFKQRNEDFDAYVHRAADRGITAIGFGVGLEYPTVPQQLIAAARAYRIGLFLIPREIPFTRIIEAVAREHQRRAQLEQRMAAQIQEELNRTSHTSGIEGIVQVLSHRTHSAVAAAWGEQVVRSDSAEHSPAASARLDAALTHASPAHAGTVTAPPGAVLYEVPLGPTSADGVLLTARDHAFTPAERGVFKHAAGLISLVQRQHIAPHTIPSTRLAWEAVASHMVGLDGTSDRLTTALAPLTDADGRVRLLAFRSHSPAAAARAALRDRVVAAFERSGLEFIDLPAPREGAHLVFAAAVPDEVVSLLDATPTAVSAPTAVSGLSGDVLYSVVVAMRPAHRGQPLPEPPSLPAWTGNAAVRPVLHARFRETLQRIHDADPTLFDTAVAFLTTDGHVGDTAATLGIHRHTARARLQQIAALGCDLSVPETRAELLILARLFQPEG
ncbi:PucR family transcriptional regulator [Corynebacterium falsenii]|uniref:PucR family transcriptional regulator n=1 Tax=Corynebacterium falsenii TaxID=108486 RepID=UPI001D94DB64|nr:PucR family transcriptional regulator [Corynebacterium falsenii]HJF11412.1 PucR family transcriptional regulator [Corynebacterium falsenii]